MPRFSGALTQKRIGNVPHAPAMNAVGLSGAANNSRGAGTAARIGATLVSGVRGAGSWVLGTGLTAQLVLVVLIVAVVSLGLAAVERAVAAASSFNALSRTLVANTQAGPIVISQSTAASALPTSSNERGGMEYSWVCWLNIDPSTFGQGDAPVALRQVMHKGSAACYPLLSPGVFLVGGTNTLRVYQGSVTEWDKHVDIPNIPVGKWFHLAVVLKGSALDVFINGNVAGRIRFDAVPRLNTGGVYVMAQSTPFTSSAVPTFAVAGPAKGLISRLKYYAYALTYPDLDAEVRAGPSTTIVQPGTFAGNTPPYFADNWWVTA